MATKPFFRGSIWSDGATPPAAKVLTTGYVVGDEVFLDRETLLSVVVALSGTAPTSVDLQLEQSFTGAATDWTIITPPGPATLDGEDVARYMLTPHCYYRFSAKRTGGDGTTALLALGYTTEPEAFPGKVDEDGALLIAGTATVSGDVAHDAADSGNPVKMGAHARNAERTAVDNDDRVDLVADLNGELVIAGHDWTNDAVKTSTAFVAGTATNVNGGNRDAGTQTVTLADDDPAVVDLAAIEVLQTTIAGDTTSIDGKTPALGTGVMAGSSPVTIATDDTQFGTVGDAADVDGNIHGQLRYIGESVDGLEADLSTIAGDTTSIDGKTPALGSAAMAGSVPVTVATDDTQFGAVGAASDVDGNVHGQLRYIGEALDGARTPSEQTLVDATNLATNTTFTVDFEMDNYRYFALQGIFSVAATTDTLTVTILARVGDGQFEDITSQVFGVANWTDDFTAFCDVPLAASDIRVQYVTSNDAGGDCDLKLTLNRIW